MHKQHTVTHTPTRFCVLLLDWAHGSVKSSRFQSTQDGKYSVGVGFFFLIRQNGGCIVRNFRRFLFGISDVLTFKFCDLQITTFLIWISVNKHQFLGDILTQFFSHPFDFYCLTNSSAKISIYCKWFFFSMSYDWLSNSTSKSDKWITIISWYIRTHTKEKPSKILKITSAILPFQVLIRRNTQTKLLSWVPWENNGAHWMVSPGL